MFGKYDWIPLNIAAMGTQGKCPVAEWGKFSMVFQLCDFKMTHSKRITNVSIGRARTTWSFGHFLARSKTCGQWK